MEAEIVLGDPYRLKAVPSAGVKVIAIAEGAFGLRATGAFAARCAF
jgi:hypothetical protein